MQNLRAVCQHRTPLTYILLRMSRFLVLKVGAKMRVLSPERHVAVCCAEWSDSGELLAFACGDTLTVVENRTGKEFSVSVQSTVNHLTFCLAFLL